MTTATRQTTRRRAAHLGPERRRPMILDVAFELFLKRGYRGTSMNEIARVAGVSKPVVYSCFKSKSELFLALLDREEQRMLAQFGLALAAGVKQDNLEVTLITGLTSMLQSVIDTPEVYRMALLGGGEVDAVIDARVRHGRDRQVAVIEAVARHWLQGSIPEDRLELTVQFVGQTLVSIGEGGVRTMLTSPERWTPQRLGRELGRLAAHGYAALVGDDSALLHSERGELPLPEGLREEILGGRGPLA